MAGEWGIDPWGVGPWGAPGPTPGVPGPPVVPPAPPPPTAPAGASTTPTRPYAGLRLPRPFLGFGLLQPFQRDQKGDFAAAGGEQLIRACVAQVLGTYASTDDGAFQGELPWRPEFGSVLYRLRFRANDTSTQHLAQVYVRDALERWEPRVALKATEFERRRVGLETGAEDVLLIHLRYDIIIANVPGNQVIVPDVTQTVRLA